MFWLGRIIFWNSPPFLMDHTYTAYLVNVSANVKPSLAYEPTADGIFTLVMGMDALGRRRIGPHFDGRFIDALMKALTLPSFYGHGVDHGEIIHPRNGYLVRLQTERITFGVSQLWIDSSLN